MDMLETTNDTRKKTINVSVQRGIIHEAKELNLNISRHAEKGIKEAIQKERSDRWRMENEAAIQSHNKRVDEEGLLIDAHWME